MIRPGTALRTARRASVLLPVLAALLAAFVLGGAGEARAADYRYWSFWERDGQGGDAAWTFATQGPSTARPADGSVQGLRFAVTANADDAAQPRGTADFTAICAATPGRADHKRVALVVDFGTTADAPDGETPPKARTVCARVPEDATTADALAAVAGPLRYDSGALLCAIAGYPESGCGEPVTASEGKGDTATDASPAPSGEASSAEDGPGPSAGLLVGVGAVAVLAAAAVWRSRRRRRG
ncbi:SCO2322 family protein [Streptomyces sp. CRN 30]|uniref:SCO2322 family protein n=1 Tax=Streptomyces sp. CRN 30 TaxID=3075613 RepID=UPI0039C19AB4